MNFYCAKDPIIFDNIFTVLCFVFATPCLNSQDPAKKLLFFIVGSSDTLHTISSLVGVNNLDNHNQPLSTLNQHLDYQNYPNFDRF